MIGIESLIGLLFVLNFFAVFMIYPLFMENRIKQNNKRILNAKIKISNYRYFSSCFNCGCLVCIVICEFWNIIRYPAGVDYKFSVLGLIICLIIIAINLYRLIFIYPRRYVLFKNNKMYYHNGFREICVENIKYFTTITIGWRVAYSYLLIKTDKNKSLWIDALLFDEPENIYSMLGNMTVAN